MAQQNAIKSYSKEEMEGYCTDHIDKCKIEPIIREAFHQGLISPRMAFIHLRIAQLVTGAEKINYKQIAQEVGLSSGALTPYKNDPLKGISQKVHIQLLIKTHLHDLLDMYENNGFIEALTAYVNKYRRLSVTYDKGDDLQKGDYELSRETDITKDVCRKVYAELVKREVRDRSTVKFGDDVVITAEIIRESEVVEILIKAESIERKDTVLKCDKKSMVHEVVARLGRIIGGYMSGTDKAESIYLKGIGNRKLCYVMEYFALKIESVYLL